MRKRKQEVVTADELAAIIGQALIDCGCEIAGPIAVNVDVNVRCVSADEWQDKWLEDSEKKKRV